jgi:D-cysteine desulfhydrase
MDLSRFPRRRYTPFATPLEFLPNFTKALAASCPGGQGPEVWIKRDDMLGLFPGGNKTRKLEFLVADALAQGADTLVTCGAPQSNHCRITLAAAVKEGLKCRFVIEERVPDSYDVNASGNNFMFRLMGVEAITVVPGGSNMAAAMQKMADEVAALGRKAYIIPGGGSNAIGGLGYVACAQELQQQLFEQGVQIDRVVVGSGSSGTHGGLVAGFLGNHINIPIVGIGVSRDPADQQPLVLKEAQAVCGLLGLDITVRPQDVVCVGGYWQPKYSVPGKETALQPSNIANPAYFHKVVDCQWACPAHTPVPEYIRLIAQGRYGDAYMVNWVSNVFPGILGRTCDRPCEPACRRGRVEEANASSPNRWPSAA